MIGQKKNPYKHKKRNSFPGPLFFGFVLPFTFIFDWLIEYLLDLFYLIPYVGWVIGIMTDIILWIFVFSVLLITFVLAGAMSWRNPASWIIYLLTALLELITTGVAPGWTGVVVYMYSKSKATDVVYNRRKAKKARKNWKRARMQQLEQRNAALAAAQAMRIENQRRMRHELEQQEFEQLQRQAANDNNFEQQYAA